MAGTGTTAYKFIENVDERLNARFLEEKEQLLRLKRDHLGDSTIVHLAREDVGFYSNRLMERDYQIDQGRVSDYFEEDATLRRIFDLYEGLFNIRIVFDPNGSPGGAWAHDVQYVRVHEGGIQGPLLGGVYLDLHRRRGKGKNLSSIPSLA